MTVAYFCILIAIFIPLFCAVYSKSASKMYNNRAPRDYIKNLTGKSQRAYNAQMNSYETFAPFAAGVIIAHQMHAPQTTLDAVALAFIGSRIFYVFFYITDRDRLRSAAWFAGLLLTVSLFFIGR